MIEIENAKKSFMQYVEQFKSSEELGFQLKEEHTYNVMKKSKKIAEMLRIKWWRYKTCRANRFITWHRKIRRNDSNE